MLTAAETKIRSHWLWDMENLSQNGGMMPALSQGDKPEVLYRPVSPVVVGQGAHIVPTDHYARHRVTNGRIAYTSTVLAHDELTGAFETLNTRYVLDTSKLH